MNQAAASPVHNPETPRDTAHHTAWKALVSAICIAYGSRCLCGCEPAGAVEKAVENQVMTDGVIRAAAH